MFAKKILVIHPETHETRVAVYLSTDLIFLKTIIHSDEEIDRFENINDQREWRRDLIWNELKENGIDTDMIEIIMTMSGLVKPLKSGIYEVNEKMKEDLIAGIMGKHTVNLGGLISADIAETLGKKAYIADAVVTDEMEELARVTGHPMFKRKSIFHALSHKFVARKYARSVNRQYEDLNLIVAHIGSEGISVGAHKKGKVVDVNNVLDGDGPFSITRPGTLPVGDLVRACYSGKYSEEEMLDMMTNESGYAAYLGTSNINEIDKRIHAGDETANYISRALAYQVSKEIGAMCTVLEGEVDAVLLSGNIFNSERFINNVTKRVNKIADVMLYPSVNNFESLMMSGLSILNGEAEILEY